MLTVSLSASEFFSGLMNSRAELCPDLFSSEGGVLGLFFCFLFDPLTLVLVLEFVIHVYLQIENIITVTQLVYWSGAG